jgi:hypothetical protein
MPNDRKDVAMFVALAIALCIGIIVAVIVFGVGPD